MTMIRFTKDLPFVIKGKLLKVYDNNDQIHQKIYPFRGYLPIESSFIDDRLQQETNRL